MATEKRLIDANALGRDSFHIMCEGEDGEAFERCVVDWDDIETAPTIDAVEVVRCKDCKQLMLWCKPTDKVIGECFIRKMNSEDEQFCMVGADDFCSYGERKIDV